MLAEGRSQEEMEELDIALGMAADPDADAKAALHAYQEQMGMTFDDPDAPVAPTPDNLDGEIRGKPW